jgi:hypothetical protein
MNQERYISVLKKSSYGGTIGVGILKRLIDQCVVVPMEVVVVVRCDANVINSSVSASARSEMV